MTTTTTDHLTATWALAAQDAEMMTGLEQNGAEISVDSSSSPQQEPVSTGGAPMLLIMLVMLAGIMILTTMSGRKERKKHAALISSLGKKDKVRAAGGIIGTIIEIKDDELLLETDRSSNTRIRVARSTVSSVLSSSSAPDSTKETASASEQG